MTDALSAQDIRQLRLRSQKLIGNTSRNVVQIMREVFALQSQNQAAGLLSVRARSTGLTAAGVEKARNEDRLLIRTWVLRGTIHLIASEDAAWVLPYLNPRFSQMYSKRNRDLGLTDDVMERAQPIIREVLSEKPMTRIELAKRLTPHDIPTDSSAMAHLMYEAATSGIACYGPDEGTKHTYALLNEWVDVAFDADTKDVPIRLAERYLRAYAPATAQDFAGWVGIPISEARTSFEALGDKLIEIHHEDEKLWMLKEQTNWLDELSDDVHVVKLLPAYDTSLLGYKRRDWYLPEEYTKHIFPGGGLLKPSLLVDGRIIGTWRMSKNKHGMDITVEAFEALPNHASTKIEHEADDIGRFLETAIDLRIIPH